MLRIAHISDLHVKDDDIQTEELSALQWLAKFVAGGAGFSVEGDGHSDDKFVALANVFKSLKPEVIVVTGDVTNFGDAKSFALGVEAPEDLKEAAGARHVFCVPGNHDALVERAADVKKNARGRALMWLLSKSTAPPRLRPRPKTTSAPTCAGSWRMATTRAPRQLHRVGARRRVRRGKPGRAALRQRRLGRRGLLPLQQHERPRPDGQRGAHRDQAVQRPQHLPPERRDDGEVRAGGAAGAPASPPHQRPTRRTRTTTAPTTG